MKSKTKEGKRKGDTIINHGCIPNECVIIEDLMKAKNKRIRRLFFILCISICLNIWGIFETHYDNEDLKDNWIKYHETLDSLEDLIKEIK